MAGKKAVVKISAMPPQMQNDACVAAAEALNMFYDENEVAGHVKAEFEKKVIRQLKLPNRLFESWFTKQRCSFFMNTHMHSFISFLLRCNNNDPKKNTPSTNDFVNQLSQSDDAITHDRFTNVTVSWIVALFCRKELWFICDTWRWKVLLLLHWSNRISALWYSVNVCGFLVHQHYRFGFVFSIVKKYSSMICAHPKKCWIQRLKENLLTFNL